MKKETKIKIALISLVVLLMGSGVSFASWVLSFNETGQNTINTRCFKTNIIGGEDNIKDTVDFINLGNNATPMSKDLENTITPYAVKITNSCSTGSIKYSVVLNKSADSTLDDDYIYMTARLNNSTNGSLLFNNKLGYSELAPMGVTGTLNGHNFTNGSARYIIKDRSLLPGQTETLYFRLWLYEDTTASQGANKTYYSKITYEANPA